MYTKMRRFVSICLSVRALIPNNMRNRKKEQKVLNLLKCQYKWVLPNDYMRHMRYYEAKYDHNHLSIDSSLCIISFL